MSTSRDLHFMTLALQQAAQALWQTHPNPMVGAVIVDPATDQVLAKGFHHGAGQPHAEIMALRQIQMKAPGAELYVTLEPCNHWGRTPPCTEAIIGAGIKRCIIATVDPDPRVSGSGIQRLREAGIDCTVGVMHEHARQLNAPFFTRIEKRRPWITLKWAMTWDGKIATHTLDSQWISGPASRQKVHRWRAMHEAILVGTQTVLQDNPKLNVRLKTDRELRQPLRILLDRTLKIPLDAQVFKIPHPIWLVTSPSLLERAQKQYHHLKHVSVKAVPVIQERYLDLQELFWLLAEAQITTLFCEGGGTLLSTLVQNHTLDRVVAILGSKIVGGEKAPSPVRGLGFDRIKDALELQLDHVQVLGDDVLLYGHPKEVLPPIPDWLHPKGLKCLLA